MNENTFLEHLKKKEYDKISEYRVENAIILAAGFASRFAPLSYTTPKALLNVRGEILIERQISQLLEAGIPEIYVVTGYLQEKFRYLADKYPVRLIYNPEYQTTEQPFVRVRCPEITWETAISVPPTITIRKMFLSPISTMPAIPHCMQTVPQKNTV